MNLKDLTKFSKKEIVKLLEEESNHDNVMEYLQSLPKKVMINDISHSLECFSVAVLPSGEMVSLGSEFIKIIDENGKERTYDSENWKMNYYISEIVVTESDQEDYNPDLTNFIEVSEYIKKHNQERFQKQIKELKSSLDNEYIDQADFNEELSNLEYEYSLLEYK